MGKRRRVSDVSFCSEGRSDQSESDVLDEDFPPRGQRTNAPSDRKIQNKNKRRNVSQSGTAQLSATYAGEGGGKLISHPISSHAIQAANSIRVALLRWYSRVHTSRGMPWRKPYNPTQGSGERAQRAYEVWVSEIMLQQTQVVTVIPYYIRWMAKFPTIRDLAKATVDEVNALWKGLGYYSRASRLLAGAKKAVEKYDGRLPDNAEDLEKNIPGIGRYSAGAIASIAYGERVPVLDGNVHRLLSRILALHAPPKSKATLDILWTAATDLVQIKDGDGGPTTTSNTLENTMEKTQYPGDINQALIELGSTVCKVRDPDCGGCPLRNWCRAFTATQPPSAGDISDIEELCVLCQPLENATDVTLYPMKAGRKKPREELDIVNIIEWQCGTDTDDRWFLMVRRPEGGLLAGLYEFPTSADVSKTISLSAQHKAAHTLLGQILLPSVSLNGDKKKIASANGLQLQAIKQVKDVPHIFSHIRKTYRPQWVSLKGGDSPPLIQSYNNAKKKDDKSIQAQWVKLDDVAHANIGTGMMKVWNLTKELWEDGSGDDQ